MKTITYLLYAGCNERCLFCFNHWRETGSMGELSFADKQKIIRNILALRPKMLTFSGGEPLLDKDFLPLLTYTREHNPTIPISVQTNATCLSDSLAGEMKKMRVGYLFISLHGSESVHNILTQNKFYQKTIAGITTARHVGLPVIMNTVVTKLNIHEIPTFLQSLAQFDVSAVQLSTVYGAGSALVHAKEIAPSHDELKMLVTSLTNRTYPFPLLLHAFDKKIIEGTRFHTDSCGAGEEEIAVFPNGDVTLCPAWEQTYGNILKDAWEKIEYNVQHGLITEKEVKTLCHECGGCALSRKAAA